MTRIAAGQRMLVTTRQLGECGLGKDAIAYRVASGRLHQVFQSVYSVGGSELPPLALELAALLACGKNSLISHRSAAYLWGMQKAAPALVEVSVVGRNCWLRKGIRVHRIKAIDKRELRRHEGLWVSSPARAVLEVAATASITEIGEVVDEGIARRVLTSREQEAVLKRHRGRPGSARLGAVLGDDSARAATRSRAERAFLKLIRDAGLPPPLVNRPLGRYVPDFMWPEERLIVEIDSYRFHAGPGGFENDHDKDLAYRAAGFDVLRPTRNQVVYAPTRILVAVAQGLARRPAV